MLAGSVLWKPTFVPHGSGQRSHPNGATCTEQHGKTGYRGILYCALGAPPSLYMHDPDETLHRETYLHLGSTALQATLGIPTPPLTWHRLVCSGPGGPAFAGPMFMRFAW
jgi:hypothetical protein